MNKKKRAAKLSHLPASFCLGFYQFGKALLQEKSFFPSGLPTRDDRVPSMFTVS